MFKIQRWDTSDVKSVLDSQGHTWIEVEDNGIGMDEHVLGEYLLKLGNTYYDSPEFMRQARVHGQGRKFVPIARFGIGLVSAFMLGETLEIRTRRYMSPRGDDKSRQVRMERMGGLAFITEMTNGDYGTVVRIRLRSEYASGTVDLFTKVVRYIQDSIIRPSFNINVDLGEMHETLTSRPYLSITDEGKEYLNQNGLEGFIIDVARWSKRLTGRILIVLSKTEDCKLSHVHLGKRIHLDTSGGGDVSKIKPYHIIRNYGGNLVDVNGFRMTLKKLVRVVGGPRTKLPALFDVSVVGDADIIYDVSRDRIAGNGSILIKDELRKCLLSGLSELGILDKMTEATKNLTEHTLKGFADHNHAFSQRSSSIPLSDDLLQEIKQKLPTDVWPRNIHKTIAKDLGISVNLVYRAISALIATGSITKPIAPEQTGKEMY